MMNARNLLQAALLKHAGNPGIPEQLRQQATPVGNAGTLGQMAAAASSAPTPTATAPTALGTHARGRSTPPANATGQVDISQGNRPTPVDPAQEATGGMTMGQNEGYNVPPDFAAQLQAAQGQ